MGKCGSKNKGENCLHQLKQGWNLYINHRIFLSGVNEQKMRVQVCLTGHTFPKDKVGIEISMAPSILQWNIFLIIHFLNFIQESFLELAFKLVHF